MRQQKPLFWQIECIDMLDKGGDIELVVGEVANVPDARVFGHAVGHPLPAPVNADHGVALRNEVPDDAPVLFAILRPPRKQEDRRRRVRVGPVGRAEAYAVLRVQPHGMRLRPL